MTRLHKTTFLKISIVFLLCGLPRLLRAQQSAIALLKEVDKADVVILADSHARELARFADDKRRKGDLRWVPGGEQLSYRVRDDKGALTRLVIVDLKGAVIKEISIEPETDPDARRPRFIEDIVWITERKFRVIANMNNWTSIAYEVDLESGVKSHEVEGQGPFVSSPDGKHIAYLGKTWGGPDETRDESVEIHVEGLIIQPVTYRGPETEVFRVFPEPTWSEDSKRVAFVEKMVKSGEAAVAFLSIDGKSDRIPLPSHFGEDASLTWLGDDLTVRDETEMLVVNHRQRKTVRASAEMVAKVEREREAKKQKEERLRALAALRTQFSAREAVAWPE